jgi:hypothetical protein
MATKLTGPDDIREMLSGLHRDVALRIIDGARADTQDRIRELHRERAHLIRRQMAMASTLGYPSGYFPADDAA